MRILYIHASFVPPPLDPAADRFSFLSETLEGDVLQPVWFSRPEEIQAEFGQDAYPVYRRKRFQYHWLLCWGHEGVRRKLAILWFYITKGLELHRRNKYDCIVVYAHQASGLMAALLKLLTGTRLVVEIVTAPHLCAVSDRPHPRFRDRLRQFYSDLCLHLTVLASDRTHLLYPTQLQHYRLLRGRPASVFHEFVPVSFVPLTKVPRQNDDEEQPFILLVGAPWYLKGGDLLVEAFREVSADYPNVKLKFLGYYPDKEEVLKMTDGLNIEILKAIPNPLALQVISRATIFVLPSRCEGMPRVLLEAMAAAVPVIGSNVGGIPDLVRNGKDGLIFERGDAGQLTKCLRELLSDASFRTKLGANGYERAHTEKNEQRYVDYFTEMVKATAAGGGKS